jgi:hypothetical protein
LDMPRISCRMVVLALAFGGLMTQTFAGQLMPKAQVANLISKVENGVDNFRDYLNRRGENARSTASSPPVDSRRAKRGTPTESQKASAEAKGDELDDALGDLNRTTNRLRRKFDATDAWIETKVQVEQVLDEGRKINQIVARGKYGTEAARLWSVLRSGINDLARAYNLQPMAL